MKSKGIIGVLTVVSALVLGAVVFAEPWQGYKGSGGWGMRGQYQRMYDPSTVETITGTVETVDKVMPAKGMKSGIHLTVRTDKGAVVVHLGPEWYIERLDAKIEKGDAIEVKGSKVTRDDKTFIIAAEVKKGENTLILRDAAGVPAWAGWKR